MKRRLPSDDPDGATNRAEDRNIWRIAACRATDNRIGVCRDLAAPSGAGGDDQAAVSLAPGRWPRVFPGL
jgi:hypothetical protein